MNYKNNLGYFNKSDTMRTVGLGILVGGFAALCIGFATSYILYFIGGPLIVVGALLFIIGAAGRSNDEEIKHCITRATEGMEVDLSADRAYAKRIIPKSEPEIAQNYEYREGVMLTRSKSNSLRSSEYTKSILYLLTDALYIVSRSISLVEDKTLNVTLEIPYAQIEKVEIFRDVANLPFKKKTFTAHITRLIITYDGGKTFTTPIHDDITTDQLAQKIEKHIADSKKAQ
ncbi:MAG: hypothetical protein IJW40_00235 [Clostridia bacterium]|nr:hypothetical protein [Clostridia bacterium]